MVAGSCLLFADISTTSHVQDHFYLFCSMTLPGHMLSDASILRDQPDMKCVL